MTEHSWGGFRVEVDDAATWAWYEDMEEYECVCGHCRNFVLLARERKLPAGLLDLLDGLGVPPEKAHYVCELYDKEDKLYYQAAYRLGGRILEEPAEPGEPAALPDGISLWCGHEPAPGMADGFPAPHFDLVAYLWLPWADGIPLGPHEILLSSDLEEDTRNLENLLRRVIPAALSLEQVTVPWEVDVLLTDDAGIRAINSEQRGVDAPTDVLSFPMFELSPGEKPTADDADPDSGLVPLGDMCISLERARAQGEEFGHGTERELAYLAVHSVLHLLGYDHLDEGPMKAQMRSREEAILERLGLTRQP